jgi:hypothetical protein
LYEVLAEFDLRPQSAGVFLPGFLRSRGYIRLISLEYTRDAGIVAQDGRTLGPFPASASRLRSEGGLQQEAFAGRFSYPRNQEADGAVPPHGVAPKDSYRWRWRQGDKVRMSMASMVRNEEWYAG